MALPKNKYHHANRAIPVMTFTRFIEIFRKRLLAGHRPWMLLFLCLYAALTWFGPEQVISAHPQLANQWALSLPAPETLLPASPFRFLVDGLMLGGILILGVFNMALFAAVRDRSHLWFAAFGVTAGLYVMSIRDYLQAGLWPASRAWDDALSWCLIAAIFFCFIRFSQDYLHTRSGAPVVHTLLNALAVLMLAGPLIGAPVIGFNIRAAGYAWNALMSLAMFVAVMAGAVRCHRIKPRPAKTFLAGNACFVAGGVLHALGLMGFITARDAYSDMVILGMLIQVLIFSLGITDRYVRLKRRLVDRELENERLTRQAVEAENRELEARVAARTIELEKEKEETERLLYNILPIDIAREIRRSGRAVPRRHDSVSILFTDFEGFTPTVGTIPAHKLVEELNRIFSAFDDIVDRHGLEKIKTIGDGIQVASGLPKMREDHAAACVRAGLEMIDYIDTRNRASAIKWRMRVGVHSGSVVAGVVGKRKFTYDIWGDTVNIASRMENAADPGRINVSAYTYDLIREEFDCEYRGKIEVKGKGRLDMYHVACRQSRLHAQPREDVQGAPHSSVVTTT